MKNKELIILGVCLVILVVLLNNQTKKRTKKKLSRMKKNGDKRYELVKASYNGYFKVANTKEFLNRLKL